MIERTGTTGIWDTPDTAPLYLRLAKDVITTPRKYIIHLVAVDEEENKRLINFVRQKCPDFKGEGTGAIRSIKHAQRVVKRTE